MPEKTRGRVPAGRLLHHRRPRQDRRARLRPHRRARQGPHHHRRLQRLSEGGRERDRRDRRRRRERRDRRAASRFRRGRDRGRGASGEAALTETDVLGRAGGAARQVQAAEAGDLRRRPAAQHHGQGAEERAARHLRHALRAGGAALTPASPGGRGGRFTTFRRRPTGPARVIQPACSLAKNSVAAAMSSGVPRRFVWIDVDEALLPVRAVALPLPLRRRVREHEAGRDRVHGDAVRRELPGELLRQADEGVLCRRIGLDAGEARAQAGAGRDGDDPARSRRAS